MLTTDAVRIHNAVLSSWQQGKANVLASVIIVSAWSLLITFRSGKLLLRYDDRVTFEEGLQRPLVYNRANGAAAKSVEGFTHST